MSTLLVACAPDSGTSLNNVEMSTLQDSLAVTSVQQQLLGSPFGFRPLSREPVPQPTNGHIINRDAAIRLGKVLFWDIQAGSDGIVACATCHATAGADARRVNTINPGFDGVFGGAGVTGSGQTYVPQVIQTDDIVGSQGVQRRRFLALDPDPAVANESCTLVVDPQFGLERRVEFRNAQTVFGAVFFRNLFWGGEANHEFNGLNINGFTPNSTQGSITRMDNSALASQAVGPAANGIEMRCAGRPLNGVTNSLGAKLLARPPLQFQQVSRTDSVLGALANPSGNGLLCGGAPCTYGGLIEAAYGADLAATAATNFSMIWGESIQAYESTLIPDQTPFDRFLTGRFEALTPKQIYGLIKFAGKGKCVTCHNGPMLSDATLSNYQANGPLNRDGGDQGFHNIGLPNSALDVGRGDVGAGGARNSESGSTFDNYAFRTPSLRNVKLTAPYFHTGSHPSLEAVVDFFDRGGDNANPERSADIQPLRLTAFEKAAIVDFLANGLTDCRVEKQRAPFDHPSLSVVNGAVLPAVGAEGTGPCRHHDDDDDDDDDDDSDGHDRH
jgi:cytochrome c peroxidase